MISFYMLEADVRGVSKQGCCVIKLTGDMTKTMIKDAIKAMQGAVTGAEWAEIMEDVND